MRFLTGPAQPCRGLPPRSITEAELEPITPAELEPITPAELSPDQLARAVTPRRRCWMGYSGPAIDTLDFMRPSLVHDCLYQAAKEGLLPHSERKTFDELLRLHCRADGMFGARAWWVHRAVRTFGGPVMRKPEKVLVAPAPKYRRPLSEYARGTV